MGYELIPLEQAAWVEKARFWAQQARDPGIAYRHSELGYNYRMSNVLAGIGRGQLEVLDLRVQQRRAIAFRYRDAFADLPGISLMPQAPCGLNTNWLSCFLIQEQKFGCSRDELIRVLDAANIESRPVWKPMHLQPLYASCECYGGDVAEDLFRRGMDLPPQFEQPLTRRSALRDQPGPSRRRCRTTFRTRESICRHCLKAQTLTAMSRFDIQRAAPLLPYLPPGAAEVGAQYP
jgi:pyridoxal phosphate-dependent aminotransferase EpsN